MIFLCKHIVDYIDRFLDFETNALSTHLRLLTVYQVTFQVILQVYLYYTCFRALFLVICHLTYDLASKRSARYSFIYDTRTCRIFKIL